MSGSRQTRTLVVVCGLLCVVGVVGGFALSGGVVTASDANDELATTELPSQLDGDADAIRLTVELDEDGSAAWTIEFWQVLEDDDSEEAFESLRADIEDDPDSYTADFAERIDETVATAEDTTGREMQADGFDIETERQSLTMEYGIVRYSFDWEGFARVDGDTIHAGDAIDGLFLDDTSRLRMSWPDGYERQSVDPDPDESRSNSVLWRGSDTEFLTGEPRLVVAPADGTSLTVVAVGLTVILVVVVATWHYQRRRDDAIWMRGEHTQTAQTEPSAAAAGSEESAMQTAVDETTPGQSAPTQSKPEPPESHSAASAADDAASPPAVTSIDPSLMSNEEQVVALLTANGGRLKQQTVVAELGWTEAKTSKVVSALRDAGEIDSFRIGRENVLRLAEDDTDGSGSGSDLKPE